MQVVPDPDASCHDQSRPIEPQRFDRRTANCSAANDPRGVTTPAKMVLPACSAWIKESYRLARAGIGSRSARLFIGVTPETGPAKVGERAGAAPGFRQDVIEHAIVSGQVGAGQAILAQSACSAPNPAAQRARNLA